MIQLLSLSFFVALDWGSTDDKLAFHINTLDCCMHTICMHTDRKDEGCFFKFSSIPEIHAGPTNIIYGNTRGNNIATVVINLFFTPANGETDYSFGCFC